MEGDSPPTWPNRRPSPSFINPILLILLIPILTLILILLLIPSFVSLISNIITIKPGSLKKSWDSLNILLVLVAVICAILAKRNDNLDQSLDISDQPLDLTAICRLKRNSSSYPDLRQVSDWDTGYRQLRYFDDFELKKYNEMKGWDVKVIPVDTFGAANFPPASEEKKQAEKQIQFRSVQKQGRKETEIEVQRGLNTHSTRVAAFGDEKRRRRRQKTRNVIEEPEKMEKTQKLFPPPTPPPPPPPVPPPSFYDIFKRKNKNKRVHSVSGSIPPPPPPPPPPPLSHIFNNMFKTGSKSKRFEKKNYPPSVPPPPPPPPPRSIFNNMFKTKITSKRKIKYSNYIPPPPPPPPSRYIFNNMFETGIKIKRSEKPPLPLPPKTISRYEEAEKDVDLLSYDKMDGGDRLGLAMVTCPSPDVNTKADTFIARLKGEWKLEKMKSMREKQLSTRN